MTITLYIPATKRTKQTTNSAMSTITMPNTFDLAVKEMCQSSVDQAVKALAAKYGFDHEEAMRELGEIKLERKRGPQPKGKTKATKEEKTKAPKEDKPKRAKTGYLLFADHVRDQVKEDLMAELAEGEKLTGKAVVSAIAALWSEQDKPTKEEWQARAKAMAAGEIEEQSEEGEE